MSEIIGRQVEVGVAVENTRGTAINVAEKWIRHVTASIMQKVEKVVDDTSRGRIEDAEGARITQQWVEGELAGIVHADVLGYLLYNVYGAVSSANVAGSVYDHTFSLQQGIQHASLSMFIKDGAVTQFVVDNCMIGTLTLTAAIDDYLRFSANVVGAAETTNSDTPSYDTEYDFVAKDITVKIAATEGALGGASAIPVKDLEITWDQGLIRDHVVGSYNPDDVYNAKLMIEGSFTLNFANTTYKDLFNSENYRYLQITIQGAADLGSGNNPTITILLNRAQFMDWSRAGGKDELVAETVNFRGFYNASDTEASTVVLRNLTSEYDTAPTY